MKGKGLALILGGPEEEGEPEMDTDGVVIASEIIKAIKAADAEELYEALCTLEDHLHENYRKEE